MTNINDLRRKALIGKSALGRVAAAIQYADHVLAKAGNKAKYKVGWIVVMTDDAIENYGEEWRDVPLRITSVATKYMPSKQFFAQGKPEGYHPSYDDGAGGGLYDLERVDGGKVNMSLYDWELTLAPDDADKAARPAMRKGDAPRTESLDWGPARAVPNGEGYSAYGEQEDIGNFQADIRLLSDGTWSASFFCQIWTEAERTYDHKSAQAAADSAESMFADAVASQEDESNARSALRNTAGERRDWPAKAARPAMRKSTSQGETVAVNKFVEGSRYYVGKDGLVWYAPGGKTASNTGKSVDEFVADVKAGKVKAKLTGKFA